jgi:hypothetical protein
MIFFRIKVTFFAFLFALSIAASSCKTRVFQGSKVRADSTVPETLKEQNSGLFRMLPPSANAAGLQAAITCSRDEDATSLGSHVRDFFGKCSLTEPF